jgi:hypothetical protein
LSKSSFFSLLNILLKKLICYLPHRGCIHYRFYYFEITFLLRQ